MSGKKTINEIVFLGSGAIGGLVAYDTVLKTSNNPNLAVIAFIAFLAFWIGTLRVIIRR